MQAVDYDQNEQEADERTRIIHEDQALSDPFTQVYHWTWDIPLSRNARLVYHYILYRAGSRGRTWPTRREMAAATGLSERSIHDAIHALENQGLIVVEDHRREGRVSDLIVRKKEAVLERQGVLQKLQDQGESQKLQDHPLATVARGSRKICKRVSQNLQLDKGTVDTPVDTPVDALVGNRSGSDGVGWQSSVCGATSADSRTSGGTDASAGCVGAVRGGERRQALLGADAPRAQGVTRQTTRHTERVDGDRTPLRETVVAGKQVEGQVANQAAPSGHTCSIPPVPAPPLPRSPGLSPRRPLPRPRSPPRPLSRLDDRRRSGRRVDRPPSRWTWQW